MGLCEERLGEFDVTTRFPTGPASVHILLNDNAINSNTITAIKCSKKIHRVVTVHGTEFHLIPGFCGEVDCVHIDANASKVRGSSIAYYMYVPASVSPWSEPIIDNIFFSTTKIATEHSLIVIHPSLCTTRKYVNRT